MASVIPVELLCIPDDQGEHYTYMYMYIVYSQ